MERSIRKRREEVKEQEKIRKKAQLVLCLVETNQNNQLTVTCMKVLEFLVSGECRVNRKSGRELQYSTPKLMFEVSVSIFTYFILQNMCNFPHFSGDRII